MAWGMTTHKTMSHRTAPADQATGLRNLLQRDVLRVLPVLGGGPSVGRSAITARLAQLASQQQRIVVLDQTDGEVARQMGVQPRADLHDLLTGDLEFPDVAMRAGPFRLIAARRGLTSLLNAEAAGADFFKGFLRLAEPASLALLNLDDDEAALPTIVEQGAGEILLVTTPRTTSMTATYARIKRIGARIAGTSCRIRILVNGALDHAESRRIFGALAETSRNFLGIEPAFAGYLPTDEVAAPYGVDRRPPTTACLRALADLAGAISGWQLAECALDAEDQSHYQHLQ